MNITKTIFPLFLLSERDINHKLKRISIQILETIYNIEASDILFIGIGNNGSCLTRSIIAFLDGQNTSYNSSELHFNKTFPLSEPPKFSENKMSSIEGKHIFLVDDVLNSGKTLAYAMYFIMQYKPKSIRTVILINRKHAIFPIKVDYVGLSLSTTIQQHISVKVQKGEYVAFLD